MNSMQSTEMDFSAKVKDRDNACGSLALAVTLTLIIAICTDMFCGDCSVIL